MTKPGWLKVRPPAGKEFQELTKTLKNYSLNTVCQGANCPNMGECWSRGTATFMIMGSTCTRNCRFCAVKKGRNGEPLDPSEPGRLAEAAGIMDLKHVVLTSVDRDDLDDGGAGHFADSIKALKALDPAVTIEVLIPDFQGEVRCLEKIISAGPDIIGHNIETPFEFQTRARDRRAGYALSLHVLKNIKQISPTLFTKSSLMLGLGETEDMILRTMDDLKIAGVDILTIGQYLRPTVSQLEVREYITPEKFADYKKKAEDKGFSFVMSGPLVRSSYKAEIINV